MASLFCMVIYAVSYGGILPDGVWTYLVMRECRTIAEDLDGHDVGRDCPHQN